MKVNLVKSAINESSDPPGFSLRSNCVAIRLKLKNIFKETIFFRLLHKCPKALCQADVERHFVENWLPQIFSF